MSTREEQALKIREIANALGCDPAWLDALINLETGGTYDPLIKNPLSSARGLIQIIDSTAKYYFNMSSEALVNKYNTFESQMDNVVYPYLKRYAPFPTKQSLYMAVFYPAYRNVDPDTSFPPDIKAVNPGVDTVADYIKAADRRLRASSLRIAVVKTVPPLLLLATGAALWFWTRN